MVKEWLRLDSDDTSQDTILNAMISAAEKYISKFLGYAMPNDDLAKISVCQMVAGWFENREDKNTEGQYHIDETVEKRLHILRRDLGA